MSWTAIRPNTVRHSERMQCLARRIVDERLFAEPSMSSMRGDRAGPSNSRHSGRQALPGPLVGPVERAALARWAASCFSETGFFGERSFFSDEDIGISFRSTHSRRGARVRNSGAQVIGKTGDVFEKCVDRGRRSALRLLICAQAEHATPKCGAGRRKRLPRRAAKPQPEQRHFPFP